MDFAPVLEQCKPHIKEIAKILVLNAAKPALLEAVEKSESKIDDMVLAALLPALEAALLASIERA
jgi:hypothetical protein